MSEIKKLIERLCPEGVEYKPIWQLTAWDKKFNGVEKSMQKKIIKYPYVLAKVFDELEVKKGDVKLLSTGISDKERWTTEAIAGDLVCEGEIVAIPWGGTPNVKYYKGKFVTADNRIATSLDTNILNNKFLFYYLNNIIEDIAALYRGAGIQHPSMKGVLSLEIPVPPIEVQSKIVEILDNFTELESELESELEARRKQYEYYRNQLLTFDKVRGARFDVKWMKLGDVCDIKGRIGFRGYTIKDQVEKSEGALTLTASNIVKQHIDYNKNTYITWEKYYESPEIMVKNGDIIVCQRGSIGKIAIVEHLNEEATINPQLLLLKNINCNNKYLTYYLTSCHFQKALSKIVGHGTVQMIAQKDLKNLLIPIIPEQEQQRIVSILDRFEALTTDLQSGLPAEIEARRKQYEYYREQLLTFKRKTA